MLGHHFPLIVTENAYVRLCHHYISFTYKRVTHNVIGLTYCIFCPCCMNDHSVKSECPRISMSGGYNLRHDFPALNEVLSNLCRLSQGKNWHLSIYTLPYTWKCLLSFVWWDGIEMLNLRLTLNIILFHIKYLSKNSEKCHIQKSWSVYYIPEAQGLRL